MRNDDVQDLIAQLERLQVQQTELLVRLRSATDREASLAGDFEQEAQEPKGFTVGDKVTIKNPNVFQANQGTITKIGPKRITVTSTSGQKILRAPKNLAIRR
jgi:transcription antitermination factor NusG